MKQALLSFLLAMLPIVASAEAVEIDGIYYNLINKAKQAEVTRNPNGYPNDYYGDIVIPASVTYSGVVYIVTSVNTAFSSCLGLTSVTIPNSVTSIDRSAFSGCSSLTSVAIPNSVTSIGGYAFSGCSSLASVDIPNSVTSIESYAFYKCSSLTSVDIPNSVTGIGSYAFSGCSGLKSVTIPNSVTFITENVFRDCYSLTSVTIPNSVTGIGSSAFSHCYGLTSVTIPNSVTYIGSSAFSGCSALPSVTIPNSVTAIGSIAFKGCSSLVSVTIPNSVTFIDYEAFQNCKALTSLTIPNSVKTIGERAFKDCSNLTTIIFGSGVKTIKSQAFTNCPELTDVYCFAESVPKIEIDAFRDSYIEYATLHVPESILEAYNAEEPWKNFGKIVTLDGTIASYNLTYMLDNEVYKKYSLESGTTITPEPAPTKDGYTFGGWSEIPKTMPANDVTVTGSFTVNQYRLTYYVDGEFYTSYNIDYGAAITPEAYPTKDGYAFSGWTQIPETMPAHNWNITGTFKPASTASGTCGENLIWRYFDMTKTLTISGSGPMDDYTYNTSPWYDYRNGIQSVVIEDGVASIGNHAFHDCMAITSLVIPNSVKSIGVQSFAYCYKLTSLTIPNGVNLIMNYAFWDCIGLSSITIPKTVTSIGDNPFSSCDNLSSITVDAENPIYDSRDNCNAIIESSTNKLIVGCINTIIPDDVVAIGDYAFNDCRSITNVSIPSSVTSIGRDAFWCCKGITSLVLPDNIVSIGSGAFFFCNSLASINIPNSVTSIGSGAFNHCSGLSSFDIPNSVSSIEKFTFAYCDNLVSVTIPSSIVSIGDKAFFECNNLTSVIIEKQVPVEIEDSVFTNRTNATLYVPAGCRNAYAAAEYWMEFKEIVEPKFKLTYYVDGNEYKTAEMEYNTIIIPETEPIREGYTFSGWSEIPETMPAEDVTVTGSFTVNQYRLTYYVDGEVYTSYYIDYGAAITPEAYPTKVGYDFTGWSDVPETMPAYDVTITGSFEPHYNVGNVASLIDFILNGSGSLEDFELYDMNGDGELNIGDLILILREVLKNTGGSAPSRGAVEWVEPDFTQYTAAQFVLDVPLNVKEQDIQLAEEIKQTHKMMSRQIAPGRFAVVVYSLTNSKLAPGFIEVKVEKTRAVDLNIKNMVLAKPTGETASFGNMAVATVVSSVRCENAQHSVYDLKGQKQGNSLQKVVYIENGKKIVVR